MSNKKQLIAQSELINHWFHNSLDGLTDAETNQRVQKDMNHIKYIAGHLVNAEYGIAAATGQKIQSKWDDLFAGLGKTHCQDDVTYPSIDEIKKEWDHVYHAVKQGFDQMSEDAVNKEMPGGGMSATGIFDGSVGDFLAFMNQHAMYHIGQIGILRRGLGKAPMKLF